MYGSCTNLPSDAWTPVPQILKMSFIVPFRKKFLLKYAAWDPTSLEQIKYNKYLRVLEHGKKLRAVLVHEVKISVDIRSDLEEVRDLMEKNTLFF